MPTLTPSAATSAATAVQPVIIKPAPQKITVASVPAAYIHVQAAPSALWTVDHLLDRYPPVTVVNGSGAVMFAAVTYVNSNQVTVGFSEVLTGKVYVG